MNEFLIRLNIEMVRSDLCEPGVFSSTYKYKQNIENKRGHLDN